MKNVQLTNSPGIPHGSMQEEFLCHKSGPEWWYSTGYMTDEAGRMYTYQFTLAKIRIWGIKFNILMTAVTDFTTGKHHYAQQSIFFEKDVIITPTRVGVAGASEMTFGEKRLGLNMTGVDYSLVLDLDPVKPAVWHAEDGTLKMGIEGEYSYYWSYTNLALTGKLVINGEELKVIGKGWFDKQGGTYHILDRRTQWEWFSLRFFDGEEVMLFSFPQDDYRDGTFIEESGKYRRLNDYKITPLGFTEVRGFKFSDGWKVEMKGIKDAEYTITPMIDSQFNLFFLEQLADIKDKKGKVVGYCFVELLPGVYNTKSTASLAFARVK